MREMSIAHHMEAAKRATGDFTAEGTFVFLGDLSTDQALVQAYQDYQETLAQMAGLEPAAARLLSISRADQFSQQLPALKFLFRKRLDNR